MSLQLSVLSRSFSHCLKQGDQRMFKYSITNMELQIAAPCEFDVNSHYFYFLFDLHFK